MTPFELATGKEVITPLALTQDSTLATTDPDCGAFLDQWKTKLEEAKSSLQRSKERMARYANKKRRPGEEFQVGDLVLVSARNITLPKNITQKFNHRYYGPYKVEKRINEVTYSLELPDNVQFHNAFHVSLLKRFKPDAKYGREIPVLHDGENQFEAEAILRDRNTREGPQFLIKFKGRPLVDADWLPANTFGPDHPLVRKYYRHT
ncbi:hypothetical protein KP509_22G028200 [Ceratopteris richardii]|uniref:Chromo domain-containing protein n=1 Tax=Ceratopteris richardii TaxID=49495 RepID=A0A8T2S3M3_CERRI|nr:hypothetical protein KP509_1Z217700 [Ceratopteris richardii]KAH7306755.1 hypothetical protein KP509_22G028200 [Ceratopteris richardii]